MISLLLNNVNIIKIEFLVTNSLKIASAIEISFLSMTLASRYRKSEKDKLITEQNSIENLEHLNQFKNEQTETLKKEVKIRTQEVLTQNAQLASQNKRIIQSINYAQRLQTAIQTSNKLMQSFFDTFSIYFRPKDIVSSDFY